MTSQLESALLEIARVFYPCEAGHKIIVEKYLDAEGTRWYATLRAYGTLTLLAKERDSNGHPDPDAAIEALCASVLNECRVSNQRRIEVTEMLAFAIE